MGKRNRPYGPLIISDTRLVGFEPTTHGFEDRYSDPLSYRRTISNLQTLTLQ